MNNISPDSFVAGKQRQMLNVLLKSKCRGQENRKYILLAGNEGLDEENKKVEGV